MLHEVEEIDPKNGRVLVNCLESKKGWWEPYDHLLIATGALPFCPRVPGSDARGIHGLHSLQSGITVRNVVDTEQPKTAVVIGGGYIGLEMAEALIMRGLDVSLVDRGVQVMNSLDPDMGALVSDALVEAGVRLYREEALEAFEVADGRVKAVVTGKRTLPPTLSSSASACARIRNWRLRQGFLSASAMPSESTTDCRRRSTGSGRQGTASNPITL